MGLLIARDPGDVSVEVAAQATAAFALVVLGDQRAQARSCALCHLAELLRRPPKARAELRAVHAKRHLTRQHQALIVGQLVG